MESISKNLLSILVTAINEKDNKVILIKDTKNLSLGDINNIITNSNRNTMVVKSILDTYKPKMEKLARLNAIARGVVVDDISEADIIFTDKKDNLVDVIQNARIITPFDTEIISSELL